MQSTTIPVRIAEFLMECRIMSMATVMDGIPYCAPVFFVWNNDLNCFIIKSSAVTMHFSTAISTGMVAGSVLPDVREITHIQGLQFNGTCRTPSDEEEDQQVRKIYYSRYPIGKLIDGDFLLIVPEKFKYTDNRLGFGKKIIWEFGQY